MRARSYGKVFLVVGLFFFSFVCGLIIGAVFSDDGEPRSIPPTYHWEITRNPFDPDNPPSPEEVQAANTGLGGYPIEVISLTIEYPTQDVEIFFMYRDIFGYYEQDGQLYPGRGRQIDLFIWFYDKNDIYYMANIRLTEVSIEGGRRYLLALRDL